MTSYDERFFKDHESHTAASAERIAPLLMEWVRPHSVIDIGCAIGEWLAAFGALGVSELHGVDGDYVDRRWLQLRPEQFEPHDLSRPYVSTRRYDLVLCLEVAEHLPESAAQGLVRSLVALGPVVLFSAAVPQQGGVHHLNEQWQDYWARLFEAEGYVAVDAVRRRIWDDDRVRWWYAQNMLVYVERSQLPRYPVLQAEQSAERMPLAVVHPRMYAGLHFTTQPRNMRLAQGASVAWEVAKQFTRRRLGWAR